MITAVLVADTGDFALFVGIGIGIVIGQLSLIATWGALGTGSVLIRLPGTLLLGVLAWYGLILGCHLGVSGTGSYIQNGEAVVLGFALAVGILVAQVPLWIAGRVFRWRLIGEEIPSDRDDRQFQLSHVLLGMLFVSLILAIGRAIFPKHGDWAMPMHRGVPVLLAALGLTNVVTTVPSIWASFHTSGLTVGRAGCWLLYCLGVTILEFGLLCWFLGSPGPNEGEVFAAFVGINVAQCSSVLGSLVVLRYAGLRFVRLTVDGVIESKAAPAKAAPANEAPPTEEPPADETLPTVEPPSLDSAAD